MGFQMPFAAVEAANIKRYHENGPTRFPCSKATVDMFARLYAMDLRALRSGVERWVCPDRLC